MKEILLTNRAFDLVNDMQDSGYDRAKDNIEKAQAILNEAIKHGDSVKNATIDKKKINDILYTLSEYKKLITAIREPFDNANKIYGYKE